MEIPDASSNYLNITLFYSHIVSKSQSSPNAYSGGSSAKGFPSGFEEPDMFVFKKWNENHARDKSADVGTKSNSTACRTTCRRT
jgi:hypothetical protein